MTTLRIFDRVQPDQITKAEAYLREHGPEALRNPHAMIGEQCGCRECFTCAAWVVWLNYYNHPHSDKWNKIVQRRETP